MAQQLVIPKFANEAEEAQWWFDNQDLAFQEFELAAKEGRLQWGTAIRRADLAAGVLALDPEDIVRARAQAERRGIEYREYLKSVVHRALLAEEQSA